MFLFHINLSLQHLRNSIAEVKNDVGTMYYYYYFFNRGAEEVVLETLKGTHSIEN
jgi:hypothetical protein